MHRKLILLIKFIWTRLGVLVQWKWSGEQVDGQISSEPSPQSSSLSHTHWVGMQRPPAQVNSDSRQGGEGGGQATPSHFQTPSSQELNTQRQKVFMDRQKQRIHIYKCSERLTSSGSVEWQQLQLETRSHPTHTDTGWELHSCRLFHKKHTDKERKDGSGSLWVRLKKDIQNSCSYLILVVRRSWFQILWFGEEAKIVLSVRAVFTRVSVSMTLKQVRSRH